MHYHIILTEKCNLQCKYCYQKSMQEFENNLEKRFTFDYSDPCISQVEIQKLKSFIQKDQAPTIIFYGGEPLLQIPKIKEIIDNINTPFRMQTNGQLLHLLEPEYLNKITKILISLDGNQETTNFYRGKGTYEKIIQNIKLMKKNNYKGELIARMTVAQDNPDIYKNVQEILKTNLFDSIHWQLDAAFYQNDFQENEIKNFFHEYDSSISKLIEWWIAEMKNGKVHKLYPFIGITSRLLGFDKKTSLMCGAGHSGYTITTSGKIVACPIMNNIKDFECGNLETNPANLKKISPISPCAKCKEKNFCGGRCLYSNHAKLWPEKGEKIVCDSVKHLIKELRKSIPTIKELLKNKIIKEKYFEYEKYFGPEIIP